MNKKYKRVLFKGVLLLGVLLGAQNVFAYQMCDQKLVPNILAGVVWDDATSTISFDPSKVTNNDNQVCIDVPVALTGGNKIVWNMDTPVTTDGSSYVKSGVVPAGIRHMYMMAWANWAFVNAYNKTHTDKLSISNYHIYGVLHGSAVKWALSDAWWQSQKDADGNQLYPDGNPIKSWLEKIKATAAFTHIDMHLETCGVTLYGGGYQHNATEDDVYPGIMVNQGAFGRFQYLHQQGYQLIQEGWIDNDSAYLKKAANN